MRARTCNRLHSKPPHHHHHTSTNTVQQHTTTHREFKAYRTSPRMLLCAKYQGRRPAAGRQDRTRQLRLSHTCASPHRKAFVMVGLTVLLPPGLGRAGAQPAPSPVAPSETRGMGEKSGLRQSTGLAQRTIPDRGPPWNWTRKVHKAQQPISCPGKGTRPPALDTIDCLYTEKLHFHCQGE